MLHRAVKGLLAVSAAIVMSGYAAPSFASSSMGQPIMWGGLYVGLNGGGGVANYHRNGEYDTNPVDDGQSQGGAFFGGQIGYNWQFSPKGVLGLEADFQGANFDNTFRCGAGPDAGPGSCYDPESVSGYNVSSFGTIRARLGYDMGNWLPYVTGGFAFGNVTYKAYDYLPDNSKDASKMSYGWALGAGVEYAINQKWSIKAEYMHVDLGSVTIDPIPASSPDYGVKVATNLDIARVGVNLHF